MREIFTLIKTTSAKIHLDQGECTTISFQNKFCAFHDQASAFKFVFIIIGIWGQWIVGIVQLNQSENAVNHILHLYCDATVPSVLSPIQYFRPDLQLFDPLKS
jgi:hypothetical protein